MKHDSKTFGEILQMLLPAYVVMLGQLFGAMLEFICMFIGVLLVVCLVILTGEVLMSYSDSQADRPIVIVLPETDEPV
jgi:hypothetical protein